MKINVTIKHTTVIFKIKFNRSLIDMKLEENL